MSDQRSVMKEFRFLDQKRQTTGLSADEATRYAQLRDLVGPDTAASPRSGFDVNAAAARLRESLLPGGLRSQVPAPAPGPEPLPEPEVEVAPEATALEAAWEAQPFAPLDAEPAPAADPLFDPASLGAEVRPQAWNPDAPGYDPDAPYDEAAWIAAGYDPNATYDWSAYSAAEGQPAAEDQPLAEAAAPPEPAPADVDAVVFDDVAGAAPAAPGWPESVDVEEAPAAPAPATAAWPEGGGLEVQEAAVELGEPVAPAEAPAEPELPFDPNAPFDHAKWFGREAPAAPAAAEAAIPELEPIEELAPEPEPAAATEPLPPAEPGWDAAVAQPIEIDEAPLPDDGTSAPAAEAAGAEPWPPAEAPLELGEPGLEPGPAAVEAPAASPEGWFDTVSEPPRAPALAFGDYDADARTVPAGLAAMMVEPLPEPPPPAADADPSRDGSAAPYEPAPAGAPFGEYDEAAAGVAPAGAPGDAALPGLPFDPAAASAIEPGSLPEGYGTGSLALDPASLAPPPPGGYDEATFPPDAAYGGPEGDALPGGTPLELGDPVQDWAPEQALEQGFELASDGSFGDAAHPALTPVPGWATAADVAAAAAAAAPAMSWESPPALDLSAPFEAALAPEPAAEASWAPAVEPAPEAAWQPASAPPPADELPTLGGEDILEELPPPPAVAAEGEIPPEIAAAFGEAPAADPFAAAVAAAEAAPPAAPADPFAPPSPPHAAPLPEAAAAAAEPEPEPLVEPEPLPAPGDAPQVWIQGSHRVVLHTVDGQVKRGLLVDAALDAAELALQPQGPGAPEVVGTDNVKAIFFMLAPGEKAAAPVGKKVRVTFRDGRQVAGYSPDYVDGTIGFFMIPADTRTNTGRIWVYQSAVRQVAVS